MTQPAEIQPEQIADDGLYRIAWRMANGEEGHGSRILSKEQATELVAQLNKRHGAAIRHWTESV